MVELPQRWSWSFSAAAVQLRVATLAGMLSASSVAADLPARASGVEQIMQPGMVFNDLIFPISPYRPEDGQLLRARKAEIGSTSLTMKLEGLRLTGKRTAGDFDLETPVAVYNFKSKTLESASGFQATGFGLNFKGERLRGKLESRSFDVIGDFEIHMNQLSPQLPLYFPAHEGKMPLFEGSLLAKHRFTECRVKTSLTLIQDFAGDLCTFIDCWKRFEARPSGLGSNSPKGISIMGHDGGTIQLNDVEMTLAGLTAIIGPNAVLVASGGMRLDQESSEGGKLIRVIGQGGVRSWMQPSATGGTWIESARFEYVSDRQLLQFDGGPLRVGRGGTILVAAEPWQFVRVFEGGRIVLSPGRWEMGGNIQLLDE
jgi:hypothetical protein